jgi:hypothetical protein
VEQQESQPASSQQAMVVMWQHWHGLGPTPPLTFFRSSMNSSFMVSRAPLDATVAGATVGFLATREGGGATTLANLL